MQRERKGVRVMVDLVFSVWRFVIASSGRRMIHSGTEPNVTCIIYCLCSFSLDCAIFEEK